MKISNQVPVDTSQQLESTSKARKAEQTNTQAPQSSKNSPRALGHSATVEISENAKLLQKAVELARSHESQNAQKILDLKQKIGEGSYRVNSGELAERVLGEHILSDFGKNGL